MHCTLLAAAMAVFSTSIVLSFVVKPKFLTRVGDDGKRKVNTISAISFSVMLSVLLCIVVLLGQFPRTSSGGEQVEQVDVQPAIHTEQVHVEQPQAPVNQQNKPLVQSKPPPTMSFPIPSLAI